MEDPSKFVLVEELEPVASTSSAGASEAAGSFRKKSSQRATHRVLQDEENVYEVQLKWNNLGRWDLNKNILCRIQMTNWNFVIRFVLRDRKTHALSGSSAGSSRLSADSSDRPKPSRGIRAATLARLTKLKIHRNGNTKAQQREKARQYLANQRQAHSLHDATSQATTKPRSTKRDAHSEGETLSEEEPIDTDFKSTVARLKKVSLRKFRAWKS